MDEGRRNKGEKRGKTSSMEQYQSTRKMVMMERSDRRRRRRRGEKRHQGPSCSIK